VPDEHPIVNELEPPHEDHAASLRTTTPGHNPPHEEGAPQLRKTPEGPYAMAPPSM
jgi:hypothetical protein